MRALVQRVSRARVTVEGETVGEIGRGLVILLGVRRGDGESEADKLAEKCADLRVFADSGGNLNRSLKEVGGEALVVSQFTLYADASGGRRPSFTEAARAEEAEPIYDRFCRHLAAQSVAVARGVFRARMEVELVNDGPVTLLLETP